MKEIKKKGFTLIELIAVLVIMAILALIVTPLVMNIIRKARVSADKRSVDAYGRSIELAIAGYLLDTGKFATDISQLTIEYAGDEVVCETTQINPDSSVYLAGCKVKGRDVTNYTYGSDKYPSYKAYNIGDEVTYNDVDYYVIKDSGTKESTVTLLKAEPLTVDEVNLYGAGHVNRYTSGSVGTAYNTDEKGYGGMAYYTSETCGYLNNVWIYDGCTTDYSSSEVKYVVDTWKNENAKSAVEARLITLDEVTNLGYEWGKSCEHCYEGWVKKDTVPSWLYSYNYSYWMSTPVENSSTLVWYVSHYMGTLNKNELDGNSIGVRPVIVLDKSVLPNE